MPCLGSNHFNSCIYVILIYFDFFFFRDIVQDKIDPHLIPGVLGQFRVQFFNIFFRLFFLYPFLQKLGFYALGQNLFLAVGHIRGYAELVILEKLFQNLILHIYFKGVFLAREKPGLYLFFQGFDVLHFHLFCKRVIDFGKPFFLDLIYNNLEFGYFSGKLFIRVIIREFCVNFLRLTFFKPD